MRNKIRVCIMLNPKLKEAAEWYADQRGLSLSAYIADCLLWQISHDQKRLDQGKAAFKGKPREKTIAPQPLTVDQFGATAEYKEMLTKLYKK